MEDGIISEIIRATANESGLSEENAEELVAMATTYINIGQPYGTDPADFFRWYTEDQGGKVFEEL